MRPIPVAGAVPCHVELGPSAFRACSRPRSPYISETNPSPRGYPRYTLQLFLMDDDGSNVEQVGYINIACALHPVHPLQAFHGKHREHQQQSCDQTR